MSDDAIRDGALAGSATPAWEHSPGGELDALLARNAMATGLAARFAGLGRAMLDKLGHGAASYSQSLLSSVQSMQSDEAVQAAQRLQLHDFATDGIKLSIVTAGGAQVDIKLSSDLNGVALKVSLAQGTLSDPERAALSDLGDAFQHAIDGLARQPAQLDLDRLLQAQQAHSSLLTGLSLHAALGGDMQQIDLQIDAGKRELRTSGSNGNMKLSVDMSTAKLAGTAQQQRQAVRHALEQFDDAARHGHGDIDLMAMFKQGFAQLNGAGSQASTPAPGTRAQALLPSATDRGVLSGLLDYTASLTQPIGSPNPLDSRETDSFSYQVSQRTTIAGRRRADRMIEQRQQSALSASYHEALQPDLPLTLGTDRQSQNYTYHQIEDQASSTLRLGYQDGLLTRASLQQSASQHTTVSKYVLGRRVRHDVMPLQASIVRDLTAQLQSGAARSDARGAPLQPAWQDSLQRLSSLALLVPDPNRLASYRPWPTSAHAVAALPIARVGMDNAGRAQKP
ncbi:hypothetical protein [Herbaspirillum sp. YR522]|uniref:hypothetical protein n=1 Tax=Herbaspirillum sp. YR522 TaxID=1144342 RepID=UPI00026FA24D|nr:hypothetical protein [Herbaspirillum sp. YR522]EJN08900.1 hypothetical protein PMI40_01033 [Herbaspirillum sp. YR522]